jgi:hypothetical protein
MTTMAYPARKFPEPHMEDTDRLARLETHAEHFSEELAEVRRDVKDLKQAVAALATSMEKGFAATNATIAALALATEKTIAAHALSAEKNIAALALSTEKSIGALALSMERSTRRVQVGFLMMGAGLLTVIARAFHWL